MRKFVFILILSTCCLNILGQIKKPTLMILPSDNWCSIRYFTKTYEDAGEIITCSDYSKAFLEDIELTMVISKIGEQLTELGYSLKDAERAIKSLDANLAEIIATQSGTNSSSVAISPLDVLKQRVKSDVLIQLNWDVTKNTISFTLEAFDTYTDKRIATATGTGKRNNDIVSVQIGKMAEKYIKDFDKQLDEFYNNMQINGREIVIDIRVWEISPVNLETEFQDEELLWHIQNWLHQNTVNNQFNLTDATENFASFEQVHIPLTRNNVALDARGFTRDLQKFLQKNPFNVTSKLIMQGLGKATLIIGEK